MNQHSNHICPLCGDSNECVLAETLNLNTPCWCHETTINPAAAALAHRSPNNQSCLCKRCARAAELNQVKVKLNCTEHCHICKEAEAIIREAGITTLKIDILNDDKLFDKYRKRIPVLQRIDNGAELDWPFDAATVSRFLI